MRAHLSSSVAKPGQKSSAVSILPSTLVLWHQFFIILCKLALTSSSLLGFSHLWNWTKQPEGSQLKSYPDLHNRNRQRPSASSKTTRRQRTLRHGNHLLETTEDSRKAEDVLLVLKWTIPDKLFLQLPFSHLSKHWSNKICKWEIRVPWGPVISQQGWAWETVTCFL